MSEALRLEVRRAEFASRWIFHVIGPDGENLSGNAARETYATRREAALQGEAVLQRISQQLRRGSFVKVPVRREA
jgi:hypothetical protein